MAQKKITRKELLKTPDEFLTFSEKAIHYVSANSTKVITVASIVVALIIIAVGTNTYLNHRAESAISSYAQARTLMPEGADFDLKKAEQAITSLKNVADRYSGYPSGRCALIDLGNIYYRTGQYDQAEAAYQSYLENISDEEITLKPMILDSLAYVYEAKGDWTRAAETWTQLLALAGDLLKDQAYLGIGRVSLVGGQPDKGKQAYQDLIAQFPNSPYKGLAEAELASISRAN